MNQHARGPAARRRMPSAWLTVWASPRETVQNLVWSDAAGFVIPVAWLSGTLEVLQTSAMRASLDPHWGPMALVLALGFGPLLGFGYFAVTGTSVSAIGRLLGGRADASDTRVALAAGTLPELIALPLWLPVLWHYGLAILFEKGQAEARVALPLALFAALQTVLMLWSWTLKVVTLAEVQDFSALRALSSIVLAWAAVLVLALGLLVGAMSLVGK